MIVFYFSIFILSKEDKNKQWISLIKNKELHLYKLCSKRDQDRIHKQGNFKFNSIQDSLD